MKCVYQSGLIWKLGQPEGYRCSNQLAMVRQKPRDAETLRERAEISRERMIPWLYPGLARDVTWLLKSHS